MGGKDTTVEPFNAELMSATVDGDTGTSTKPTMLDMIDNAGVGLESTTGSH